MSEIKKVDIKIELFNDAGYENTIQNFSNNSCSSTNE
jgi:hypothetical protein